ncbi:DUF4160 domain-containing protein [Aequorivita ciconiae]|uniref:DUF4160 domain-containing protein n=1 Tax=Aequorivita ciconiae TaxID=2494375 RepID=UPI0013E29875|nr:DUF4160 domain-containing protein [Aequorivita sp. H23M31]
MPAIDIILGVKIEIFSGDHPPPHIHASCSGEEVLIIISDSKVYAGTMKKSKLSIAMGYVKENRENLLAIFNALNVNLK